MQSVTFYWGKGESSIGLTVYLCNMGSVNPLSSKFYNNTFVGNRVVGKKSNLPDV